PCSHRSGDRPPGRCALNNGYRPRYRFVGGHLRAQLRSEMSAPTATAVATENLDATAVKGQLAIDAAERAARTGVRSADSRRDRPSALRGGRRPARTVEDREDLALRSRIARDVASSDRDDVDAVLEPASIDHPELEDEEARLAPVPVQLERGHVLSRST